MAYVLLILTTVAFSFGGVFIKSAEEFLTAPMLSLSRFVLGVFFLSILQLLRRKKIRFTFVSPWIWVGGISKAVNYLGENFGVSRGYSYGNVIIPPVKTVVILAISALILHEKLRVRDYIGTVLCTVGVMAIAMGGAASTATGATDWVAFAAFFIGGVAVAVMSLAQKKLVQDMDTLVMNDSMFTVGGLFTCAVLAFMPGQLALTGPVTSAGIFGLLALGLITGVAFWVLSEVMKVLPLFVISVIQSGQSVLTLIWAVLIRHEPVSPQAVAGTLLFIGGILLMQLKIGKKGAARAAQK